MAKSKERLIAVKPSGVKDESVTHLIHDLVRQIPRGRVTTYGAIAKVLGLANPRMVGKAMSQIDGKGKPVPAQRVVTSSGRLSHDTSHHRHTLLEKEGILLNGDKIVDFKKLFWDPGREL